MGFRKTFRRGSIVPWINVLLRQKLVSFYGPIITTCKPFWRPARSLLMIRRIHVFPQPTSNAIFCPHEYIFSIFLLFVTTTGVSWDLHNVFRGPRNFFSQHPQHAKGGSHSEFPWYLQQSFGKGLQKEMHQFSGLHATGFHTIATSDLWKEGWAPANGSRIPARVPQ